MNGGCQYFMPCSGTIVLEEKLNVYMGGCPFFVDSDKSVHQSINALPELGQTINVLYSQKHTTMRQS